MDDLHEFLRLYFRIGEEDIEAVSFLFSEEVLKKNDFFLLQGKVCDKFSFVKDGALRLFSVVDGKEITQWITLPGYFITELDSFTFGSRARWNAQCLKDTTLYTITKEDYLTMNQLVEGWLALEKEFIVHCFTTMENRIFQFLSQTAQERYTSFFENNKELFNQIPLHYIASMLGMSAETLSRIRGNGKS